MRDRFANGTDGCQSSGELFYLFFFYFIGDRLGDVTIVATMTYQ